MIGFILIVLYIIFNFYLSRKAYDAGKSTAVVGLTLLFGTFIYIFEKIKAAIKK